MPRPAVLFGGPSPEHDISILTGLQAARALAAAGTDVDAIYWTKAGEFRLVDPGLEAPAFAAGPPPKSSPLELSVTSGGGFLAEGRLGRRSPLAPTAVLVACHGGPGEDGTLQAALDLAGVRYTGPTAQGAAIGMDKLAFGGAVAAAGLPCLPRAVVTPDVPPPADLPAPWIVKPRFGGSSIGIEVTDSADALRALLRTSPHLRAGAVVEPHRPDLADLNISVRTVPGGGRQLSALEKPLRKPDGSIYTYAEKYLGGQGLSSAPRELPAQVPPGVEERVRAAAEAVADLALVRGVARIDFLWAGDEVLVNEVNTIPGALAWYFWSHAGVPFAQLCRDLLAEAQAGPTVRWTTDGADGSALRAAGSIASKLA